MAFKLTDGILYVNDIAYVTYNQWYSTLPVTDFVTMGCHLRFHNGAVLSLVWGTSTYSDNKHCMNLEDFVLEPYHVECAAWPPTKASNSNMIEWPHGDEIMAYVPEWKAEAIIEYFITHDLYDPVELSEMMTAALIKKTQGMLNG